MIPIKFITEYERETLNNESVLKGGYRDQFKPGTFFYMPWLYNPDEAKNNEHGKFANTYLSQHYWKDWSVYRPPIQIILPNGSPWVIDSTSTNGPGWSIIIENGELPSENNRQPKITASPSILVPDKEGRQGYHGWLKSGFLIKC